MTDVDAKVNMSLDDIIKMDKKTKKKAGGPANKGQGKKSQGKKGPQMKKGPINKRGGKQQQQNMRGQMNMMGNRRGRSRSRVRGVNSAGGMGGGAQNNAAANRNARARSASRLRQMKGGMMTQGTNRRQQQQGGFRRNQSARMGGIKKGQQRGPQIQQRGQQVQQRGQQIQQRGQQIQQRGRQMQRGQRGQGMQKRSLSAVRGGFVQKRRFNNQNQPRVNLQRMQQQQQGGINRINVRKMINQQAQNKGMQQQQRGRSRSRSRSRAPQQQQQKKPMQRTNSMPNLRANPLSIHSRLGFENAAKQQVYRNRVKKAKQVLLKRQNRKVASPIKKNVAPLMRKSPALMTGNNRLKNAGFRSDQILKNQKRIQMQQMQMNARAAQIAFMTNQMQYGNMSNMMMSNQMRQQRGRSPFRQNQQNQGARRGRSRSRSRSRPRNMAAVEAFMHNNATDRAFSEVMYSLQGNYGITGRTLNDRFSY